MLRLIETKASLTYCSTGSCTLTFEQTYDICNQTSFGRIDINGTPCTSILIYLGWLLFAATSVKLMLWLTEVIIFAVS